MVGEKKRAYAVKSRRKQKKQGKKKEREREREEREKIVLNGVARSEKRFSAPRKSKDIDTTNVAPC